MARRALVDATLASPWTAPFAEVEVRRDAAEPGLWHVRTRLVDIGWAARFEGDLPDRVEAWLAAAPDAPGVGPPQAQPTGPTEP